MWVWGGGVWECVWGCVCVREIWDGPQGPFYVDKLELTATFSVGWRFFGGLFRFACCGQWLKIIIINAYGRVSATVPSFAASCEGRTFGDEKG